MPLMSIKSKISGSGFVKKLVLGTFWMTFGSLMSRGLFSLASIVLARILTVSEFGEFGMIKSTIDNFLIFASLGIGLTTTKYISELKDDHKQEASSMLGASLSLVVLLSSAVAVIIMLFSGPISGTFLNNQDLQIPLIIGGGTLIFISLNGTQMGALLGFQAYRKNSTANILQGLFLFLGLVIGGYLGGVKGALLGNLIAIFLVSIALQKLVRDESKKQSISVSFKEWKASVRKIYKFAIPASLSTIIVAPTIWVLNTMLVNQPNGYKELGLYSAVIIFSTAIQMFNGAIGNVLLPIFLSKSEGKSPKKEFFNYFGSWIISIMIAIPLILIPEVTSLILGKQFSTQQIVPILGMSVISTLIITSKAGVSRDLIVKNKMWLSVFSMGLWAVTNLTLFYFLKDRGAWGFAFSYMISYVINYLVSVPYFIYNGISPRIIFYSKWNILTWLSLAVLIFVNVQFYNFMLLRIFISLFLLAAILFSIFKLYKECLQKL